ncbi:MAG: radical SAM protein [Acidobacteriia bacterium]|jgi:7-carboxy-7-deazaguanine synthase|nr:radical SAM protein [Terriglobia bacterium]
MKVNEIYRSVQGESSYSGLPCIFVRLTYCHLRCTYCDTEYAFYDGQDYTVNEVLEKIDHFDCSLVEITGGEPLLQKESYSLMDRLVERNYTVLLETSGSLDIQKVNSKVIKILDLKCPSSGECHRNLYSNLNELNRQDEVKFVVGDRNDYQWARKLLYDYDLTDRCSVLLSTVFGKLSTQQLVKWILEDNLKVRFQLQMHKYIWDPCKKSV